MKALRDGTWVVTVADESCHVVTNPKYKSKELSPKRSPLFHITAPAVGSKVIVWNKRATERAFSAIHKHVRMNVRLLRCIAIRCEPCLIDLPQTHTASC